MKKIILLFLFALWIIDAQTQPMIEIDDAIQGTGTNQFNYVGSSWTHGTSSSDPYLNQTVSYSNVVNNYATISFKGNRVQIITRRADHHGIAAVSIDNGAETLVDLVRTDRQPPSSFAVVYDSYQTSIKEGTHTLKIRVTGTKNTRATGTYVVLDYVRVYSSTEVNTSAGYQSLVSNTSGNNNTAYGAKALNSNTSGHSNTANGSYALQSNTVGYENTGVGDEALKSNTEGSSNSAFGYLSLTSNLSGYGNTAHGHSALNKNTTGNQNTALGAGSMTENVSGLANTAVGAWSLRTNSTGSSNTGVGAASLATIGTGTGNTGVGTSALYSNYVGIGNSAVGFNALLESKGSSNTAIGTWALANLNMGDRNTAIGAFAGPFRQYGYGSPPVPELQNTTALGAQAVITASHQVRIGNSEVTSIGGQVSWSTLSDGRFKKDIKEDVSGLEFIKQLKPISYTIDKDAFDKFLRIPDSLRQQNASSRQKGVRQTGFVAQEVESLVKKTGFVFSGVEAPKNENDHYSIRYAEFVVPLVKAMQELAAKVEAQEKTVADQQEKISLLTDQLEKAGMNTDALRTTDEVELFQNNPNPFTLDTEIKMALPESAVHAKVIVYNLEGKQLKDFLVRERGKTSVKISGSELSEGMYLYALVVDGKVVDTKRMILTE